MDFWCVKESKMNGVHIQEINKVLITVIRSKF